MPPREDPAEQIRKYLEFSIKHHRELILNGDDEHYEQLRTDLASNGVARIIHPEEQIVGIADGFPTRTFFGRSRSRVLLIRTNERLIVGSVSTGWTTLAMSDAVTSQYDLGAYRRLVLKFKDRTLRFERVQAYDARQIMVSPFTYLEPREPLW